MRPLGCAHYRLSRRQLSIALAARTFVNGRKSRQWNTEKIKRRDKSVSQSQTRTSNGFVAPRARQDPFAAVHHLTVAPEPAKKFHVLHERHFWKAAYVQKGSAPAEYPVIATPHS